MGVAQVGVLLSRCMVYGSLQRKAWLGTFHPDIRRAWEGVPYMFEAGDEGSSTPVFDTP